MGNQSKHFRKIGEDISPAEVSAMNAELSEIEARLGIKYSADEIAMGTDTAERTRYAKPGQRTGNGYVRKISDAQVRLIKRLMRERNTSTLVRLPGSEDIENMSLTGARDLIDRLTACPELANIPVEMPTDKQINYMRSLWIGAKKGPEFDIAIMELGIANISAPNKFEASALINALKEMPKAELTAVSENGTDREPIVKGMVYRTNNGDIYRVQKARQSDNLYALKLNTETDEFEFVSGAIRIVQREGVKLSMEERAAYGKRTASCMDCGRELRVKLSLERGVGPICWDK
jgi:hypothetical protein